MKKRISQLILLPLLAFLLAEQGILAQGTAFSYQGQLTYKGALANGNYDLQFVLYDAQAGGKLVAGPVTMNGVAVANGLLAVRLDFGAGTFTGAPRWLEISARPAGAAAFSALTPLQEVTSSPYAIFAASAGTVANGAVTANQLNTAGLAPKAGQILSYNGGNLLWTDPGVAAGSIWSVLNNDAYYSAGNVGVGGLAGTSKLQITGADALTLAGPGTVLTWRDTTTGRNAAISSAGGTLYYRVPDAAGTTVTAGYVDSNGSVVRGRLSLEGAGPYITWNDTTSGKSATISSALGTLYYRVPDAAGTVVTAGYVDSNGSVVRGRISLEGPGPYITWNDSTSGKSAAISSAGGTLYYRVPNAAGSVVTAGYVDSNGLVVNGRIAVTGDINATGAASVATLTIRGGADLAEPFDLSDGKITKGSVLIIDSEHPGKLRLSNKAYDQRVAGIVSGANGINPGISLRQEGALEGGENVALSGRVYVLADASFGEIKPGDLLTTSDTPGHAMKTTDRNKAQGAILGKAMSSLKEGKGMVLTLVTLQ